MWEDKIKNEEKITKTIAKDIAKDILIDGLAKAYYQLVDSNLEDLLGENEKNLIYNYIDKYGNTMAKSINKEYYTI